MELINPEMKVVYKGTKEEFYEIYELCHQLQLKLPNFYCRVIEPEENGDCYLEISFVKMDEYYNASRQIEMSDRAKEYFNSYPADERENKEEDLSKFWKLVENYQIAKPLKKLRREKKKKERIKKKDGRIKNKVGFEKEEELTEEKVAEMVESYKRLLDSGLLDKVE